MAIPVITDHFQAQWIWEGPSGLPEDVYITTWYFRNDTFPNDPGASIETALSAFWMDTPTGGTRPLAEYIPGSITSARLKVYDLGEPLPRYPVYETTVTGAEGLSSNSPYPFEVAVVNSYYGGQGPRMRGRNYIGPVTSLAAGAAGQNDPRPSADMRDNLAFAATDLQGTSLEITWVQVSTTFGIATPVIGGWVDDAFDTQRRRGTAPSTRTTWGSPAT